MKALVLACLVHTAAWADDGGDAPLDLPTRTVNAGKKDIVSVEVKSDYIRKIPSTMNDPVRAVSFAPGVTVQNDLNVRPFVRGGEADQTQVVMNGLSLLQPYHMGGVFSVFNLNTVESIELYRDDFPIENPGALSGVLKLKSKRPSLDRARAMANLSLVRGDLFAEIPVIAGKASVYGAAQAFLFNRSLHGMLDVTSRFSEDSVFQQDIQSYRDRINMPEFQDYHWGAFLSPGDRLQAAYAGSYSADDYAVVVPKALNIVSRPGSGGQGNPIPNVPVVPHKEINRSKKLSIDSISSVDISNHAHFLNFSWDADEENFVENAWGFQTQGYAVDFKKPAGNGEPLALSQSSLFLNFHLSDTYSPSRSHQFKFGAAYDYKRQDYDVELPYVLYDVIVNSNMDMLEPLGNFSEEGFTIAKEDSSLSNFDYLGEYPSRIRFSHRGALREHFAALFFSHTHKVASGTVSYGIRGEFQSTSREFFPGPRASYRWNVDHRNEISFNAGLYSQNTLPFYERDRNPSLKAEKSSQVGVGWGHQFAEGYRMKVDGYYKRYFDMIAPTLVPNGSLDMKSLMLPHPRSGLSEEEIGSLKAILDTAADFQALPDSIKRLSYETFGDLIFDYSNAGVGNSLGAEISFFYQPTPVWSGWMSADFSLSDRQDHPGEAYYPYRYHRPAVFNWVNYFDMPSDYDFSLTYRWALGQPYTPYSGAFDGKGSYDPISIGARNSGRLSPYSRLDIRLSRNARWGDTNFKAFVEVWNSMNSPNYFARDENTGQLKSAQLNWPFPLFFLGVSAEL